MHHTLSCHDCAFFEDHIVNMGKVSEDAGLCRYNPPVTQPEPDAPGLWPVVSSKDWCGHFEEDKEE